MADHNHDSSIAPDTPPRWPVLFLILGLYLTLRGYHSRDGDQAYRLPLLLHRQDPSLFADDPFVRAFDAFNPHHGYIALLDLASRPLGLSAGLFLLFAMTFAATCHGLDRLSRAAWPGDTPGVGLAAIGLALTAKAGNIGTVHVFEAMLLDRLVGLALGWLAIAWAVERPETAGRRSSIAIGLATLVHPSVGLQLAMVLGASWVAWGMARRATNVDLRRATLALVALGLAIAPGVAMQVGQGTRLFRGLTPEEFRLLSVELQNPQHMLPHLWRMPQWLAFACYPILALLALARPGSDAVRAHWPAARARLAIVLAVSLAGVGLSWVAVEVLHDLRVTVLQPFRMATLFRGLAIVALSGRVVALWRNRRFVDRCRALILTVGMAGDWMLVVATAIDLVVTTIEAPWIRRLFRLGPTPATSKIAFGMALLLGLAFLSRHDTGSGHWPLLGAVAVASLVSGGVRGQIRWTRRRSAMAMVMAWAVPMAALLASSVAGPAAPWAVALVGRCRFTAVPIDDIERLAVWCRAHTPAGARFIGPPGPKTFRLWSLRTLAFNRAASPYHAAGLADWSSRFRDHVGFDGPAAALVRAYQDDRHGLERRYQEMSDARRAALAVRQGAGYVVAAAPASRPGTDTRHDGPLELLHVEGRYAVYRVREPALSTAGPRTRH